MTDESAEPEQAQPSTQDEATYGTSGGVPITEELIEQLAAEAEAGYDVKPRTLTPIFDDLLAERTSEQAQQPSR